MIFVAETRIWEPTADTRVISDSSVKVFIKSEFQGKVFSKRVIASSKKPFQLRVEPNGDVRILPHRSSQGRRKDEFLSESTIIPDKLGTAIEVRDESKRSRPDSNCTVCERQSGKYCYPKQCNLCSFCEQKTRQAKHRERFDEDNSSQSRSERNSDYIEYLKRFAGLS